MTLAARYNAEAKRLMPHMADDLAVDPEIDNASHIDEIVFRRSEYLGGMAAVLLALIAQQK
jgi:hypothetical protein